MSSAIPDSTPEEGGIDAVNYHIHHIPYGELGYQSHSPPGLWGLRCQLGKTGEGIATEMDLGCGVVNRGQNEDTKLLPTVAAREI